jgi:hypothetical protein
MVEHAARFALSMFRPATLSTTLVTGSLHDL